jgi:hypothetical protein
MHKVSRNSSFFHPFIRVDVLYNPYWNWSINFEFTHNVNFSKELFKNITPKDVMGTGRLQYSSTKFYLYKNSEMVVTDYDCIAFEKYLKEYYWSKNMMYEQILKEFYLGEFQKYIKKNN